MLQVVESVLNEFDWVFYLDSDAWITNPEIPLETLLPAQGGADFVVTEDAAGANAGAWIIRSSDWSRAFLKEWWGLESFVRVRIAPHLIIRQPPLIRQPPNPQPGMQPRPPSVRARPPLKVQHTQCRSKQQIAKGISIIPLGTIYGVMLQERCPSAVIP